MYERFSGQARKSVQLAAREAHRLDCDYVGTEHLLLGVLREGSEDIDVLLKTLGADSETVYRESEAHLSRGAGGVSWDKLPLTPSAKRAIEFADEESFRLGHPCVGPVHLLLGAVHETDSSAAQILLAVGITLPALRQEVAKLPWPENRDWLLQPRSAGPAALVDPSARDLERVVTEEVMPLSGEDNAPGSQRGNREIIKDDRFDLSTVERQLRSTQFVIAGIVGALLGAGWLGVAGAMIGFVGGLIVAVIRSTVLGAVSGSIAGFLCGRFYDTGNSLACVFGLVAGFVLGVCLGDWRQPKVPANSEGGVSTPQEGGNRSITRTIARSVGDPDED